MIVLCHSEVQRESRNILYSLIRNAKAINFKLKTWCKFKPLDASHKDLLDDKTLDTEHGVKGFTEEKPRGGKSFPLQTSQIDLFWCCSVVGVDEVDHFLPVYGSDYLVFFYAPGKVKGGKDLSLHPPVWSWVFVLGLDSNWGLWATWAELLENIYFQLLLFFVFSSSKFLACS